MTVIMKHKMAKWVSWKALVPTVTLALIFGVMALVRLLVAMIKKGPRRFFYAETRITRPDVMEDPSLGQHRLAKMKDGVRIHYVENGDPSKPLMLFIHGFPECWFSWRHQLRHFSDRYRVVAMDMRGYGESDKPYYVADYTLDKIIGDVKGLIQELGYSECVLVAHDWGGAIASGFAQSQPHMVQKLILMNIPHMKAFLKHMYANPSQLLKSWYMFFFQLPYLPELFMWNDDFSAMDGMFRQKMQGASRTPCTLEEVEAYKYAFSQPGGISGPINYYRMAFRYEPMRMQVPKITAPTLRIWGEQDSVLEKKMAELSAEYHTEHLINYIPTAGHWVMMDEPELVNMAMDNFLSGKKLE